MLSEDEDFAAVEPKSSIVKFKLLVRLQSSLIKLLLFMRLNQSSQLVEPHIYITIVKCPKAKA